MELFICNECLYVKETDFWSCPNCHEESMVFAATIQQTDERMQINILMDTINHLDVEEFINFYPLVYSMILHQDEKQSWTIVRFELKPYSVQFVLELSQFI